MDVYLRSSIRMDSEARALSLAGDSHVIVVGFSDGTVASLSWSGKVATDTAARLPWTRHASPPP
jgi:hypothetical protein